MEDWKKNCEYIDYKSSDDTIMWFWIVSNFMTSCYGLCMLPVVTTVATSSNNKRAINVDGQLYILGCGEI